MIHKESEDAQALVRLEDVNHDQYYRETYGFSNLFLNAKFYYYRLSIENASEDQVAVYNAQGSIKDSIVDLRKRLGARITPLEWTLLASVSAAIVSYFWALNSSNRYLNKNGVAAFLGTAGLSAALVIILNPLLDLNHEVKEFLEVGKPFKVKVRYPEVVKKGPQNAQGSVIIVSDHELQTVEIDIMQKNAAYYEVTLTEIEN